MGGGYFFESHYYAEGQKYHAFSERPTWAPPEDRVGISQDLGLSIRPGDYVLEIARQKERGEPVFWIGLFEKGVDKIYGDRGDNTIGLGIWVRDALLLNPEEVAEILHKLVSYQSKLADPREMAPLIEKAAGHVKLCPRDALPAEMKAGKDGVSFGTGALHKALLWHAQIHSFGSELYCQIGNFINLFQMMNPHFVGGNKLYLVISRDAPSEYTGVSFSGTVPSTKFEFSREIVTTILAISNLVNANAAEPKPEVALLEKKLKDSNIEVTKLKFELDRAQKGLGGASLDQLTFKVEQILATIKKPRAISQTPGKVPDSAALDWALVIISMLCLIYLMGIGTDTWLSVRQTSTEMSELRRAVTEGAEPVVTTPPPLADDQEGSLGEVPRRLNGQYGSVGSEDEKAPTCDSLNTVNVSSNYIIKEDGKSCIVQKGESDRQFKCQDDPKTTYSFTGDGILVRDDGVPRIYRRCKPAEPE